MAKTYDQLDRENQARGLKIIALKAEIEKLFDCMPVSVQDDCIEEVKGE